MSYAQLFWLIVAAGLAAFSIGRVAVLRRAEQYDSPLRSLPNYYGYMASWLVIAPALLLLSAGWMFFVLTSSGQLTISIAIPAILMGMLLLSWHYARPQIAAQQLVEGFMRTALGLCSLVAVLTTFGISLSLIFESVQFFQSVSPFEFLTGLKWSPQTAIRTDQFGQSGTFGAIPIFTGTFLITFIAISIAAPIGIVIAIYLSEYSGRVARDYLKPTVEVLAAIPTIVYGYFALLTVGPLIRNFGASVGFDIPGQSAIAAGLVLGIMIVPYISSLSDDAIRAVPQDLRDGSIALGATGAETLFGVTLPAAMPGILAALLLGVSRAIGETMIVVLAAGQFANLTANPLDTVTTVTVQIVALLTGDVEFDSPKTLAAFALALVLFAITLALNIIALTIAQRRKRASA